MRRDNFDGLRLLGALTVLASHQVHLLGSAEPVDLGLSFATMAVLVFFSISGYLVAGSWLADPHVPRFLARRFLRLWPGMAFAVTVTAVLIAVYDPNFYVQVAAREYWERNLRFDYFDWQFFRERRDPRLNGPLWMLQYEAGCYLAFAACAALLARLPRRVRVAVAAAAAVGACAWLSTLPVTEPASRAPLVALALFAAVFGTGAALRLVPVAKLPTVMVASWVAAIASGALGWGQLGVTLALPPTVVCIGTQSWPGLRDASRWGDLSYGIYLWGWPIQQLWIELLDRHVPASAMLALSATGAACVAWLSWHLVEKQALRLKPRAPQRAHVPAPVGAGALRPLEQRP